MKKRRMIVTTGLAVMMLSAMTTSTMAFSGVSPQTIRTDTVANNQSLSPVTSLSSYTVDGADPPNFGSATSFEPENIIGGGITDQSNVDRSKNSQIVPPRFGSNSADTPGTGYLLIPELSGIPEPVLSQKPTGTMPDMDTDSGDISYPIVDDYSLNLPSFAYTEVDGMYRADGSIGTLRIPKLGVAVNSYEGESLENMRRGIGHFTCTSAYEGNVAFSGHNRGSAAYFGQIHTLQSGDTITYETVLGNKTYEVFRVEQISKYDMSVLEISGEGMVTLITCVRNVPELRWCIQAREKV